MGSNREEGPRISGPLDTFLAADSFRLAAHGTPKDFAWRSFQGLGAGREPRTGSWLRNGPVAGSYCLARRYARHTRSSCGPHANL